MRRRTSTARTRRRCNFQVLLPNAAAEHSVLSYFVNDWSVTGLGIIQSGEPYSLYEFYGAVGSINFGNYPTLMNPVLPITNPKDAKGKALTGNPGDFRGPGGSFIPTIDPSEIAINYVAPGTNGVPTAAQGNEGDPTDIYETNFAPENQRNIFRQAMQKRLDISIRKNFHATNRISILYEFNIFNLTNTTSLDVPQDQTQIRQNVCLLRTPRLTEPENAYNNCALGYFAVWTDCDQPRDGRSAVGADQPGPDAVPHGHGQEHHDPDDDSGWNAELAGRGCLHVVQLPRPTEPPARTMERTLDR